MYQVSVIMALVDYIPVFLFLAAAILLQRDLYNKMSKGCFALFAAGTIDIVCAGFLKATWKLLYGAGSCDFYLLNNCFLPMQSFGFLMAGIGVIAMLCHRQSTKALVVAAPPLYRGTMLFIPMMVLGLGAMCGALCVLAARLKQKKAIALFVLAFVCSMGMGYLSSRDSTSSAINWIEQLVNCAGQGAMLLGTIVLHKAGLAEYRTEKA